MIRYAKSARHFNLFWSKSHLVSSNYPLKVLRLLPARAYAKDVRFSTGETDVWRKTSSYGNPSPPRKHRPIKTSPVRLADPVEPTPEVRRSSFNDEGSSEVLGRRSYSAAQPAAKSEPPECVTLPHSCPAPALTSAGSCIRVKDDCPPMKQIEDQTREVDCDHLVRRTSEKDCPPIKQLEEQRSRTECAQTSHSTIEDCPKLTAADPPQKKDECPPPRKPPMTPPRQVAPTCPPITEPPDGGDSGSSKKWLWGLLAVFLGGALTYYFFWADEDEKETTSKDGAKKSRVSKRQRLVRPVVKYPPSAEDLPKQVQYLLIGGGTASFSAFRSIKSLDPKAEVLVLSKESEFPYMRPPLSKELWNSDRAARENLMFRQWNGSVRSIYFEPDSFYMEPKALPSSSKGGVAVARGWEVIAIDAQKKEVTLDDGSVIAYGKCLLAPGSKPKPLPLLEEAGPDVKDKIFYFRDVFDFRDLSAATECARDVLIIGGGFLGSELSCSLSHQGCNVTQVFREEGLLAKLLPPYLSRWLTEQVSGEDVNVLPNTEVVGVASNGGRLTFTLSDGKKVDADYCVVATGAVANTDLAEASKLETHPTLGGYLVNSEMLARSNLYVAGDAACFYDERFGRRRIEHHDHGVVSGRLAGENMVGAGKPYLHVSMLWSDLSPDIGWEGVGILDPSLETVGVFALDTKPKEDEGKRPETETTPVTTSTEATETPAELPLQPERAEKFNKGVVFYRKDGIIVGILLWNVFNRMQLARQILKQECKYDDLNEVAKLFQIHAD